MPAVFTAMDRQQRAYFHGRMTRDVAPTLRKGTLDTRDRPVRSEPLYIAGSTTIVFRGAIDAVVDFTDGRHGLIDFKTVQPAHASLDRYALQLHAYAWALERPAPPTEAMPSVDDLGLLCFSPGSLRLVGARTLAMDLQATWVPVTRDDEWFRALLVRLVRDLERPEPPQVDGCAWCVHLPSVGRRPPAGEESSAYEIATSDAVLEVLRR